MFYISLKKGPTEGSEARNAAPNAHVDGRSLVPRFEFVMKGRIHRVMQNMAIITKPGFLCVVPSRIVPYEAVLPCLSSSSRQNISCHDSS